MYTWTVSVIAQTLSSVVQYFMQTSKLWQTHLWTCRCIWDKDG